MNLADCKITGYETSIQKLPDRIVNQASWLKAQFDARTDKEVKEKHNALVDALLADEGESGADGVGAYDRAGAPTTVQAHILNTANPHGVTAAQVGAVSAEQAAQLIAQAVFESGSADMTKAVYDPSGKNTDIFAYVDAAITAAITSALNGEV